MSPRAAGPRVVAIGYQGFGNLGDEAILTGIEQLVADQMVHFDAVICGPRVDSVAGFPAARRIRAPRLLPSLEGLRALWSADVLLLTGGGLLHDHWATIIPRYLAWIALGRALGARVVWLGVGIGPVRRRSQRLLLRLALALTAAAFVRDEASARLLGGRGSKVTVMPDPALFNHPPDRSPTSGALAIVIRGPAPAEQTSAARRASDLAVLCLATRAAGWCPTVLTMAGPSDEPFAALIRAGLRSDDDRAPVEVEFGALGPTPADALDMLSRFEAVISVRLHGVLLAAVCGIPCVPVAYDMKVRAAAEQLGIGDLVIEANRLNPSDVLAHVARAGDREVRATVASRLRGVRASRSALAHGIVASMHGRGRG